MRFATKYDISAGRQLDRKGPRGPGGPQVYNTEDSSYKPDTCLLFENSCTTSFMSVPSFLHPPAFKTESLSGPYNS